MVDPVSLCAYTGVLDEYRLHGNGLPGCCLFSFFVFLFVCSCFVFTKSLCTFNVLVYWLFHRACYFIKVIIYSVHFFSSNISYQVSLSTSKVCNVIKCGRALYAFCYFYNIKIPRAWDYFICLHVRPMLIRTVIF